MRLLFYRTSREYWRYEKFNYFDFEFRKVF